METVIKKLNGVTALSFLGAAGFLVLAIVNIFSPFEKTTVTFLFVFIGIILGVSWFLAYKSNYKVADTTDAYRKILQEPQLAFMDDGELYSFTREIFGTLKDPSTDKEFALKFFGNTCERSQLQVLMEWCYKCPELFTEDEINSLRQCLHARFAPQPYDNFVSIKNFDYDSVMSEMDVAQAIKSSRIYQGFGSDARSIGKAVHTFLVGQNVPANKMEQFVMKLDNRFQDPEYKEQEFLFGIIKVINYENNLHSTT